ncbi:MAG: methylmalonyl-CoA mutase family protein [Candidatus Bathyarchaeota archaeon]|nr:MAG: methylmalonyl-CoA mutase family protein [Candidatus Bathyarchaeota archaeon]
MRDGSSKLLTKEHSDWKEKTLTSSLKKFKERKGKFATSSNIVVERVYTPLDLESSSYLRDVGFPGAYPFTRGIHPTMYRARFWTMRQYAGFGTAEQTNQRFRYLLEQGQTGLSVAFDFPTQVGLDCDHPLALGEVGKVGVSVGSLEEMELLFNQIPLDKVTTSMTINAPAIVLLAMYVAVAQKNGITPSMLGGTTQNDILKEYVARGMYIYPPTPSMKLVTDVFEYCSDNMPRWHTISISGYHIREAGATAVQEVAFTLANGIAYVQAAVNRGLNVDEFARRLSFFFACHSNFLEEVAKFRAARRLWARIIRHRFDAKAPASWQMRFHTQTSGVTLTAPQPENNIVRVALQAFAAVLGGTQSLHTNSYDEAYALPSKKAATIALRTQQIIANETGVSDTVDPLAGSYCIEALTVQIEEEATRYIERIDQMGGAVKAIESGFMQREITNSAYIAQQEMEKNEQVIVGVNQYITDEGLEIKPLRVSKASELKAVNRLSQVKRRRNNAQVKKALHRLQSSAEDGTENLFPLILTAVKEYATLGEVCSILKEVYGEHRALTIF